MMSFQKGLKSLKKLIAISAAFSLTLAQTAFPLNAAAEQTAIAEINGGDLAEIIVQNNGYRNKAGENVSVSGSAVTTVTGIGGKAADDVSVLSSIAPLPISAADFDGVNNHKQFLSISDSQSVGSKYFVAEVNFFPVNGYSAGKIALQPNSGVFITPFVTTDDSKINIDAWNNIRIVTQPSASNSTDGYSVTQIYVNGTLAKEGRAAAAFDQNYIYPYRLMFDSGSFGGYEQKIYFDDFKVYASDKKPTAPTIPTLASGSGYTVDDSFGVSLSGAVRVSDLKASFGTISAYSDESYSVKLADDAVINDGAKITVASGTYMNTYTASAPTDGTLVYKTRFSSGTPDSGLTLANKGFFTESYATGIGGKTAGDTSLNFARPQSTDTTSGFMGNNIYTYVLAPTDKQYIKYEINLFPANAEFSGVKFATQGHGSISPTLTCTDSGSGENAVLERNKWNRIVYIIKNNTIPADTSSAEMSFSVDVFVNGKEVCKNAAYKGKKFNNSAAADKTPIRFAIYGSDKNNGDGTTLYSAIDTYLDDITVTAHDEYPQFSTMPQLIADGKRIAIDGNVLTVYESTTVADLKCSDGAAITVFDTATYDYKMVGDNPLYDGNLIIVTDSANNMSYYTVKKELRNYAQIIGSPDKVTARANLKDAALFLTEYDENGNMIRVNYSTAQGETSVSLDGEFALAKAMVIGAGLKPMCEAKTYVSRPSIACWGDSITYSQGCSDVSKTSYPAVLGQLSGLESYNMGVGGETNTSIASRQGGYTIRLDEAITIPAERTAVEIKFSAYDKNGDYAGVVTPRNASIGGWNPCVINGVEGTLAVDVNNTVWPRVLNSATFTRKAAGDAVSAAKGDRLVVDANNLKADINIVNASSNGGWGPANKSANDNDSADLINTLDSMIANFKYPDKFIIIGVTTGGTGAWAQTDAALKAKYGEHFHDVKSYLTDKAVLTENGVILTYKDNEYLAQGKVPPSLLNNSPTDDTHLNDVGYRLFAQRVYAKMQELGYAE